MFISFSRGQIKAAEDGFMFKYKHIYLSVFLLLFSFFIIIIMTTINLPIVFSMSSRFIIC